jgi:hypothetical protein
VVVERGEEALWFLSFLGARGNIPFAGAFFIVLVLFNLFYV